MILKMLSSFNNLYSCNAESLSLALSLFKPDWVRGTPQLWDMVIYSIDIYELPSRYHILP